MLAADFITDESVFQKAFRPGRLFDGSQGKREEKSYLKEQNLTST